MERESLMQSRDPWQPTRDFLTALAEYEGVPRPEVKGYCKTCLGPRNLKPLPAQEAISPAGIVHYGTNDGDTLCGKDATGNKWWWPL